MSAEDKATLKKARECYLEKSYMVTIKLCKKILKKDPNNYTALVLIAAALHDGPGLKAEAIEYLKKATSVQPENPTAWKGLVGHYEKQNEDTDIWGELITSYCKVLRFDSTIEVTKFEQYLYSCSDLILQLKDDKVFEEAVKTFESFYENEAVNDAVKMRSLNNSLAVLLTQYPNVSNTFDSLLEKILSIAVLTDQSGNRQDYYKRYLKLLYKLKKFTLQLQEAAKMHDLYSKNTYPLEWISRTYSEQVILYDSCKDFAVTRYYENLLKLNNKSYFALLAKAVDMYIQKNYIASRDLLNYIVSMKPIVVAYVLLIEVNMKLYSWELAENAAIEAEQIMTAADDNSVKMRVKLNLIESAIRSNNLSKCTLILQNYGEFLNEESPKKLALLARIYVILQDPKADTILEKLENFPEYKVEVIILKAMQLFWQNRLQEAVDILENAMDSSEAWALMGKIYLKMADYGHSHMAFLKGVQADPNNWECLVYLGHHYKDHGNNLDRSKKCYQKALQINPNSDEAGINLSIVYRKLKDDKANLQLLDQMTADGKGPKWAWLQLGLVKLDQHEPAESIKYLRNVIRIDPNDSNSWETLADAYFARGAFTSAMKSYQKALELRPESFYSMMQVAHIKLLLSQYEEAKEEYEKVIEKKEDNWVALKGLAETHMGLAKNYISKHRVERASHHVQIAVNYLVSIVSKKSEFSCAWKLLGNACFLMAKIPEKYCCLSIPTGLIKLNNSSGDSQMEIRRRDILTLCVRSYCRALNLVNDSSLIWHDLAMAYFTQLQVDGSIDKKEAIVRCLSAIKHAVRLCPTFWYHWNLLGVICMSDHIQNYALAQHSFATAIDLEHTNPVTWANLGSLYLKLHHHYKANEAFSWAQRSDPSYVNSWIGQAIIAEDFATGDAMDLFRHATQICYHPQGALGYAHWVVKTLLDPEAKNNPYYVFSIENMYAIPVATDFITWYIAHNPKDVCALNICGLLLERQKMYKSAQEKFVQALKHVTIDSEKDSLAINLARVSGALGDYDRAIKLCSELKNANFRSHCQLAITLFKAKRYEEAYATYENILEWLADTDTQKGHILCAMAAIAYTFESLDAMKTLLFQCIEFKPRIVSGLLSAAACGILYNDENLCTLILKELESFKHDEEYRHDIALLVASFAMKKDGLDAAIRSLVKVILCHPGDARLWTNLVLFLSKSDSEQTLTCALRALFLGRNTKDLHISKIASITSYSKLKNDPKTGIRSILKMVHAFPGCVDNWAILIVALMSMNNEDIQTKPKWISALTSIVRQELSCSQEMLQWLLKNEQYCNKISDQTMIQPV